MPTDTATVPAPARSSPASRSSSARRHPSVVPSERRSTSGLATLDRLLECLRVAVHHRLAGEVLALEPLPGRAHLVRALPVRRQLEQGARDPGAVTRGDEAPGLS